MTVTQFTIKIMKKSRIILLDNMIVKIDNVLKKNGQKRIWVRNFYSYMLWILEAKTVEMGCLTLEDTEVPTMKKEGNIRIIRLEEGLLGPGKKDDPPI